MGLDVVWILETSYRGISNGEVVNLANNDERAVLTRDSDFLRTSLRKKVRYGLIHIAEPVRKDNVGKLAWSIAKALIGNRPGLAIVSFIAIELYPLTP